MQPHSEIAKAGCFGVLTALKTPRVLWTWDYLGGSEDCTDEEDEDEMATVRGSLPLHPPCARLHQTPIRMPQSTAPIAQQKLHHQERSSTPAHANKIASEKSSSSNLRAPRPRNEYSENACTCTCRVGLACGRRSEPAGYLVGRNSLK